MIPAADEALRAWGVWRALPDTFGQAAAMRWEERIDGGDAALRAYVPIDALECQITDEFVRGLPEDLRRVVHEVYVHDTTADQHAARLRMSKRTLYERLHHAHERWQAWHMERRQRQAQVAAAYRALGQKKNFER